MVRAEGIENTVHRAGLPVAQNAYVESYNAKQRRELLNGEVIDSCSKPKS